MIDKPKRVHLPYLKKVVPRWYQHFKCHDAMSYEAIELGTYSRVQLQGWLVREWELVIVLTNLHNPTQITHSFEESTIYLNSWPLQDT
jgi:hypothetical protein